MVVLLLAASWVQPACAQTAYIIPSLQQDNPSNHSYSKLGKIIANQGLVSSYDVIMLTTDYRIDVSVFGVQQLACRKGRACGQRSFGAQAISGLSCLQHGSPGYV